MLDHLGTQPLDSGSIVDIRAPPNCMKSLGSIRGSITRLNTICLQWVSANIFSWFPILVISGELANTGSKWNHGLKAVAIQEITWVGSCQCYFIAVRKYKNSALKSIWNIVFWSPERAYEASRNPHKPYGSSHTGNNELARIREKWTADSKSGFLVIRWQFPQDWT